MSQPSPDARHVARAVDALTTQVRRLADAVSADRDDAPTTNGRPVVGVDPGAEPSMVVAQWIPEPPGAAEHRARVQEWAAQVTRPAPAPAADDDAQRTARRTSLRVILDRASRGVILRTDEAALLRQHVEAEQRDADTARRNAELADAVTAETKRLKERRTTTLRERAERAEAAIKRVRALLAGRWGAVDPDLVRAALDGTEQPKES
ncbi:hypothetical protein JTP67_05950 [Streptomyces sp. S12]|nr:hypothetical protein [Streptomyces sp. S12]